MTGKGLSPNQIDPHATWAANPPDDSEYYCECFHRERDHDDDGCSECGPGECAHFRENRKNPVEPDEPDPDRDRD